MGSGFMDLTRVILNTCVVAVVHVLRFFSSTLLSPPPFFLSVCFSCFTVKAWLPSTSGKIGCKPRNCFPITTCWKTDLKAYPGLNKRKVPGFNASLVLRWRPFTARYQDEKTGNSSGKHLNLKTYDEFYFYPVNDLLVFFCWPITALFNFLV